MEQPIKPDGHIDWLRVRLLTCKYGEVGLLFTMRDGRIIRAQHVDRETFKSQLPEDREAFTEP
jgi:hypothetical protein